MSLRNFTWKDDLLSEKLKAEIFPYRGSIKCGKPSETEQKPNANEFNLTPGLASELTYSGLTSLESTVYFLSSSRKSLITSAVVQTFQPTL